MASVTVTSATFEEIVDTNPLVILDFWAEWCGPCKVFGPIFDELAKLNDDIIFGKVNTEEQLELAQAFQIRSIPTIMAFKNGELFFEASGILTPPQMQELLKNLRDPNMQPPSDGDFEDFQDS